MTAHPIAGEDRWVSAHLFHFGDLDPLIMGVVRPVTRELVACGTIRRAFFLRYWEGGQHVRLRLQVPDPARQQDVRNLVRERAAAHFACHPSPVVDAAAYRAFAAAMARGERRADYDDRLHEPGTVAFIGYLPEYEAYGDAACVAAAERHFAVSSRLALEVLAAGTDMGRRTAIGLAALTMAVAACEPDLPSAAHRLAAVMRGPATAAAGVEEDWRRRKEALLAQTRRLWEGPESAGGLLAAWAASLRALRDELDVLHAEGRCVPRDPGSPHAALALAAPPERRTVALILMRCVHLFHNRLGLRAGAEQHTTFLAGRAVAGLADSRRWSP
ncbi:lantibiotic dehydratase C-terminal domain-containing protein [Nonomuraea salmonea]|uniref:Lantibiotic dehydratase C-terminal domain-containing protein n=2 Tax=Nonomuraea salmonea TaxID=46181 RepID=A0ABV5P4I6_9ACTN